MKTLVLFLVGISVVFGSISRVGAADSVNMSATVVERKITDTIDDFDFSSVNSNVQPQVLGASIEKNYCLREDLIVRSNSLWLRFLKAIKIIN